MAEEQRRNSGGGWLGLIGKFHLLRSWGGGIGDGEPNSESTDFRGRKKSVISGSRKRKNDCMGEGEEENVHVDRHGLRKPSFHMPLDASPMRRRESVKASASAATGTVTKGSGNRLVELGGEKEESNRKKKMKVTQEADERCSGLPPSNSRNDGNPTYMDLQRLVELEGGCDQVLGLLEKAVVVVPDAQDDMRALSPVQPTPQLSTLQQDVHSTSTAINAARRQQHRHNKITTAASNDDRQCYNSARGIMHQGSHATSTPVGALKSKKRLMRIGGERISGPERRISTQSSAKAARCILDSLEYMTSPVEGSGNLGQSPLYTDSAFRDYRRWGGGGLSVLPSKSSALCGPPPPLKSIAAESVVHGGPSETTLVVTRGRRNGNSAGTQRQQLSQEAVAEIPRLERKPDGGGSHKWLHEPSYPSSSYTPARVTSREVQVSSSSSVMNVVDNSISSPSLYSLERWQPPPKRQRATMVREQQTQTEDIGETWDVQKASLRGGGRHLTMGGGKLLLPRLLSKEKEKDHDDDDKLKRKGTSVHVSISPRRHPIGRFSLSEENESEDHLDSGEDGDATLAEGQHNKQPPLPSGRHEHNLKDNGDFVFTAPKAVVAPALALCKSQTPTEDSRVDTPKFSFSLPLENRRLSESNDETNSCGINGSNKLPFSFNQMKGSSVKKFNAPFEQKTPLPISKQSDGIQDQKTEIKRKLDTSPVKGFDMSRFRPKPGSWKCSSCLVVNADSSIKCLACDIDKPVAANSKGGEKGAATPVSLPPHSLPSPPSTSSAVDLSATKLPTPVKDKPFNFELPPGRIVVPKGGKGLGSAKEYIQLNLNPSATENAPGFAFQGADTASETTTASKAPFTFGGSTAADFTSFKAKPLSATAEIYTPSNLGVAGPSVDPTPSTTGAINPIQVASKTGISSGGGFTFGSAATTEAMSKPSNSFLSSASGFASSSPAVSPTAISDGKMDSEAAVPSYAGLSAAATVVTTATPTETVPESAPGFAKSAPFLFGAAGSRTPTIPTGSSSSKPTKLPPLTPSFTFGAASAEKPTESSAAKIQSDGKGDKSTGTAIVKPAFTFGAAPAAAPAPSSSPSLPVVQQPKPTFSFNAPGTASSPAFGGTSATSPTLSSTVFDGAPSAISSPPQPGQAFTFNATGVSGGGVQSQNATTVMPSLPAAPSFVFGSTPDSQPQQQQQQQQQQPGFSFGAGSGVGGQPGMAFGQSTSPSPPPGTDGGQFGGFGTKGGGGVPIPQQPQQQQQQAPVSFGGFSSQQQPAPQVGGIQQPGPSFGTPMGFGSGAVPGALQQKQQPGGFSMGVGASHTAKAGGTRGGRKILKCKRRLGK